MAITQVQLASLYDSNIYLISGSEKTALVDTGTGFASDAICSSLQKLLAGRHLDMVFLTHRHFDHVGGLEAIIDMFHPDDVYAGHRDAEPLRQGDSESTLGVNFGGSIPMLDVTDVRDGDIFDLGGHRLRVIETPGHTVGSICILDETSQSLFSGDTFFFNGYGRCDHPTGSIGDLIVSLKKLKNYQFKSLYPGHGPSIKDNGRDCLDKAIIAAGAQ